MEPKIRIKSRKTFLKGLKRNFKVLSIYKAECPIPKGILKNYLLKIGLDIHHRFYKIFDFQFTVIDSL